MQLPSIQATDDSNSPLLSIPVELVTKIFSLLPSFFDILALAATCRRLRHTWATNVTSIYSQVASRSIPCERYARRFLADQGRPATNFPTLSARDVLCMLRNSCVVEKAILQFEEHIVCKVKCGPFDGEKIYGPRGARPRWHPPTLTRTARPRCIRSYYQLWGMLKLNPAQWQSRLESMTLKRLFELHEMTKLWQSIGREEVRPAPRFPNPKPNCHADIDTGRSKERVALEQRIWQHIEHIYRPIHNAEPDAPWAYTLDEGAFGFVVIWDHWQGCLKQIVIGLQPVDPCTRPDFVKEYLWDDTSEEEV